MKVVLDTNVIVSGLLSPFGRAGEIMRLVASGKLELCYDARIISEYKSVLLRNKFSFLKESVEDLIDQIRFAGAGFGEENGVGVFQSEAVENDQRAVVFVNAVEDAFVGGQFRGSEGKGRRQRSRVHVAGDQEFVQTGGNR